MARIINTPIRPEKKKAAPRKKKAVGEIKEKRPRVYRPAGTLHFKGFNPGGKMDPEVEAKLKEKGAYELKPMNINSEFTTPKVKSLIRDGIRAAWAGDKEAREAMNELTGDVVAYNANVADIGI
jgi:hypothetical protein